MLIIHNAVTYLQKTIFLRALVFSFKDGMDHQGILPRQAEVDQGITEMPLYQDVISCNPFFEVQSSIEQILRVRGTLAVWPDASDG